MFILKTSMKANQRVKLVANNNNYTLNYNDKLGNNILKLYYTNKYENK